MQRKVIVASIAGVGLVAAMYAMSQVRYYSCGDFKRIQYEYRVKLEPLVTKVETLDDPKACKMTKDEIFPILEQYRNDLVWFENCFFEKEEIKNFRTHFDKLYLNAHELFRTSCVPLGM